MECKDPTITWLFVEPPCRKFEVLCKRRGAYVPKITVCEINSRPSYSRGVQGFSCAFSKAFETPRCLAQ